MATTSDAGKVPFARFEGWGVYAGESGGDTELGREVIHRGGYVERYRWAVS